ncbi:MAG: helix-turn-helix domain-containing protein [Evtepia sp.]
MIVFNRLWETMKARQISQYKLIKEYKISTGQLDRLRKNGNVEYPYTLNQLCEILHCHLEDIAGIYRRRGVTPGQFFLLWYNENGFLDDMIGGIGSHEHLA